MYKLLTEENKALVAREYSQRRTSVILALAVTLLVLINLGLAPSVIETYANRKSALIALSSVESVARVSDREALEKWVGELNSTLVNLESSAAPARPHDLFVKVLSSKLSGVKLTGLSLESAPLGMALRVRGEALDRQTLLDFQSTLQSTGDWKEVELPVGALARDRDVEFELTLIPN